MKKNVPALRLVTDADTSITRAQLPPELVETFGDIAAVAREGLLAMSVAAGMAVMQAMFDAEVEQLVGPRGILCRRRHKIHKRRNVVDHLPERDRARIDAELAALFAEPDPVRAERAARNLVTSLEKAHPGAAASLREGLPEMFTVTRLGITGTLAKTLTTSNPIESMFSIARRVNKNVTRWRDGEMVMRPTAAGMAQAAAQFRRVKGHAQMPPSSQHSKKPLDHPTRGR